MNLQCIVYDRYDEQITVKSCRENNLFTNQSTGR